MSDKRLDSAMCLGCGYSLRGLTEHVCPECGRAFVPEDDATFQRPDTLPRWPLVAAAPTAVDIVATVLMTGVYLHASSLPGGVMAAPMGCLLYLVGFGAVAFLTIDYAGRVVARHRDRARAALHRAPQGQGDAWRWCAAPLCLLAVLSAWWFAWPLRVRFDLSKPAFEKAIAQVQTGADPRLLAGSYGSYEVSYVRPRKDGSVFFQTGDCFFDSVGFLFAPSDTPRWKNATRLGRCWFTELR